MTLLLTGAALGAGAEYLFDPTSGQSRRVALREQVSVAASKSRERMRTTTAWFKERRRGMGRTLSARAQHAVARSKRSAERIRDTWKGKTRDEAIERGVRNQLERATRRSGMIAVSAHEGSITLHGDVLPHEHEQVLDAVRSVRGVSEITDHLMERASDHQVWWPPRAVADSPTPRRFDWNLRQAHWSPGARMVTGAVGAALLIAGVRQRSFLTVLGALAGAPLLLRSATNRPLKRLGPGHGVIDVHKSILVHAPVERVFKLLEEYENYPAFIRSIQKVKRRADGTSHWVLGRKGKSSLEADSQLTVHRPNEMLGWRSLPHSEFDHSGLIRFEPEGSDETRLEIHISYAPPSGAFGNVVASLFDVDPGAVLDAELAQAKSFVENGSGAQRMAPGEPMRSERRDDPASRILRA